MVEREVAIVNRLGLHARPAAQLVQRASKYEAEIKLKRFNLEVNAKSIMGVMMLAAEMGSKITIIAVGPDEKEAVDGIASVISSKFGED
jgi:phosphocarrier protein HPr